MMLIIPMTMHRWTSAVLRLALTEIPTPDYSIMVTSLEIPMPRIPFF